MNFRNNFKKINLKFQILQSDLQLYFEYGYTAIKSYFVITILALLVNRIYFFKIYLLEKLEIVSKGCAILFVPVWQFLIRKIDKKYAVILGNTVRFEKKSS